MPIEVSKLGLTRKDTENTTALINWFEQKLNAQIKEIVLLREARRQQSTAVGNRIERMRQSGEEAKKMEAPKKALVGLKEIRKASDIVPDEAMKAIVLKTIINYFFPQESTGATNPKKVRTKVIPTYGNSQHYLYESHAATEKPREDLATV
jgi:hypothetical protein